MTYGSMEAGGPAYTFGGYSTAIVVDEHFVLSVPEGLDPAAAAPLLCARNSRPPHVWCVPGRTTCG